MAATIKIKNSSTASAVPTSSDLVQGELAVNVTDKRIFTENASGTVVELGTNPSSITLPAGSASAPTLLASGDTNTGIFFPAADTVGISTGGTERARVDSAGNMGLGVTPSAWSGSGRLALQLGGSTASYIIANSLLVAGANNFYNGTQNTYIANGFATQYQQTSGAHQWLTAASGTAGNTISFTQAMTLDASGNLGVGITSPSEKLDVAGVVQSKAADNAARLAVKDTNSGGATAYLNAAFSGAGTPAVQVETNHPLLFITNNTERARIDSSGAFLLGTTTKIDNGSVFQSPSTATPLNAYRADSTGANGAFGVYSDVGGTKTVRAYIKNDGGLANYSANNVNLSDENLKKDIVLAGNYLAKICAIPVKNFRYKDQSESEDITLGVIAQDVLAVAPELVSQEGFGTSEDGKENYLSVYQTDLQYALMKAIQELKAIVDAQAVEIAALKG